jgi:hypothetical protein
VNPPRCTKAGSRILARLFLCLLNGRRERLNLWRSLVRLRTTLPLGADVIFFRLRHLNGYRLVRMESPQALVSLLAWEFARAGLRPK